jgi:hypothetical protein
MTFDIPVVAALPNMRLKLASLSFLEEPEWLCPGGHGRSSAARCAGGLVARSLSAIR